METDFSYRSMVVQEEIRYGTRSMQVDIRKKEFNFQTFLQK